jgi:hypothetical protein
MDPLMLMGDAAGRSTSLSCLLCWVYYMARIQHCVTTVYSFHPVNTSCQHGTVLQRIALSGWLLALIQINPLLKTEVRRHRFPFRCSLYLREHCFLCKAASFPLVITVLLRWRRVWCTGGVILTAENRSTRRKKKTVSGLLFAVNVTLTGRESIADRNEPILKTRIYSVILKISYRTHNRWCYHCKNNHRAFTELIAGVDGVEWMAL